MAGASLARRSTPFISEAQELVDVSVVAWQGVLVQTRRPLLSNRVPIIDVAPLVGAAGGSGLTDVVEHISNACRDQGVLQVINHGISAAATTRTVRPGHTWPSVTGNILPRGDWPKRVPARTVRRSIDAGEMSHASHECLPLAAMR